MKYKKIILAAIILTGFYILYLNFIKSKHIIINNKKIKIEIADNEKTRHKGLSNRKKLCADCGMLFIFQDKKTRSFVMRNMNFSLDIIWIDEGKILKIDKDLPPEGKVPQIVYSSFFPVDAVLEVNAGFCDENNIKIDDQIIYK